MATSIIRVKHGTTYNGAEFTINIVESGLVSVPLDLTGATLQMQIRLKFDTNVLAEYTLGHGLTLTDPAKGKFTFDNQIIMIAPGSYKYDILITLANGTKKIYPSGDFIVETVITHG